MRKKGQKIIHAFRHQSRAEGFLFHCIAAERDSLSPEQGNPTDCLTKSTDHTRLTPAPGPDFAFWFTKESGTKEMTLSFVRISSNTHTETAIWWGKLSRNNITSLETANVPHEKDIKKI